MPFMSPANSFTSPRKSFTSPGNESGRVVNESREVVNESEEVIHAVLFDHIRSGRRGITPAFWSDYRVTRVFPINSLRLGFSGMEGALHHSPHSRLGGSSRSG
jgi:hypothetical protein